ncbi:DUF3243 domain-containing protein [Bacillaceae bacterium SIJ1]|uniref:DUF3243 domain-containing protein n=1 Tax=Litoribacterium kuwaitense TaxID=1398745 RepID=UPI0013ED0860|nr:DUF3243 domain-containing protein [Litoribacterium kuwaitense]NGP44070.1 DUF3243 domain-containing protein [Litoribacterium kuwaitense]
MSVLNNFEQWKSFLGDRLQHAEHAGYDQKAISELAYQIGGYLANEVDAKNDEEKVLAELWKVADEKEQHAIANMMIKLVQQSGQQRQ